MTIIADENIDGPVVHRLRELGHSITWITEVEPTAKDPLVLERAFDANALLLTKDKDFGELIFRRSLSSSGVLLRRFQNFDIEWMVERLDRVLRSSGTELLSKFSVMTDASLRIKPLPKR